MLYTSGMLLRGRCPRLTAADRSRVEQALQGVRSLRAAADKLGVCRPVLKRFVDAHRLERPWDPRPRGGGRRSGLEVERVRAALLSAPSLIAAARALGVCRLVLRRFTSAHQLPRPDGRRRPTGSARPPS